MASGCFASRRFIGRLDAAGSLPVSVRLWASSYSKWSADLWSAVGGRLVRRPPRGESPDQRSTDCGPEVRAPYPSDAPLARRSRCLPTRRLRGHDVDVGLVAPVEED